MADLIDRQALLVWFENWSDYDEFSVRYITGVIEDEPPVDAVKVVRCKDCKYADEYYQCDYSAIWNDKNHYCGKGERKDG